MAYVSTWDDAWGQNIKSFENILELAIKEELKIPLTLFISTNYKTKNISQYKQIIKNNESKIESHSKTHICCTKTGIDYSKLNKEDEYIESQNKIKRDFGKKHGNAYAFPYGETKNINPETWKLIKDKYRGARGINRGYFNKSSDIYNIPVKWLGSKYQIQNTDVEMAIKKGYAIITFGHGIKGISGFLAVKKEYLVNHFKFLKKNEKNIWFTTFSELIIYLKDTKQIK